MKQTELEVSKLVNSSVFDDFEDKVYTELRKNPELMQAKLTAGLAYDLASGIRNLRREEKLTQQQLADKVGVPQSVISRLENPNSKTHPTMDTLTKVALALNCQVAIEFKPLPEQLKQEKEFLLDGFV